MNDGNWKIENRKEFLFALDQLQTTIRLFKMDQIPISIEIFMIMTPMFRVMRQIFNCENDVVPFKILEYWDDWQALLKRNKAEGEKK